ncbi:MAG: hypothetical protein MJ233_03510 [Mycoplasmoidaceae bacterium]|nr:hypothetical protein [Mycoplasmoidaceae bacterium]
MRSRRTAYFQTNPSLPVVLATTGSMIFLGATPFIPGLNYGLQFVNQAGVTCYINP